MEFIDNEGMARLASGMTIAQMRVIGLQVVVAVREHVGIALRPYPDCEERADERKRRARAECRVHALSLIHI